MFHVVISIEHTCIHSTKIKFSIKDFSVNVIKSQFSADLVIFTEEILNGKLHFLCSVRVTRFITGIREESEMATKFEKTKGVFIKSIVVCC